MPRLTPPQSLIDFLINQTEPVRLRLPSREDAVRIRNDLYAHANRVSTPRLEEGAIRSTELAIEGPYLVMTPINLTSTAKLAEKLLTAITAATDKESSHGPQ